MYFKHFISIWTLLSVLQINSTTYKHRTLGPIKLNPSIVNTGSIVEHLTPTYFIRGKIHLHIDLTVSFSVYAKFESLRITLATLRKQLISDDFIGRKYSWEIIKFVSLTHDRVQDLSHEVDSILELNWIKNKRPQPPRRHRRGLFDLGGRILKEIFGTATTADLETI
jgi:hypothetical protein